MKLIDLQVKDYLEVLKSDAPAPGGGSVSALAGVQGIALFMMVADLTIGKEKYAMHQDTCNAAKQRGEALYEALSAAVDADTDAYNLVSAAFRMPKDTEQEKIARGKTIADATLLATKIPYRSMELAFEGLQIAETLVNHSNTNAASDLGASVLNLSACIKGAWLNVKINLPSVKDKVKAQAFERDGQKMYDEAEQLQKKLFDEISKSL